MKLRQLNYAGPLAFEEFEKLVSTCCTATNDKTMQMLRCSGDFDKYPSKGRTEYICQKDTHRGEPPALESLLRDEKK